MCFWIRGTKNQINTVTMQVTTVVFDAEAKPVFTMPGANFVESCLCDTERDGVAVFDFI